MDLMYDKFGFYIQTIYNNRYYNSVLATLVKEIFDNIKNYCIDFFEQTDFFELKTRTEAIKKLQYLEIILGNHDYFVDLTEIKTCLSDDFFENFFYLDMFYKKKLMEMVGKTVNKRILSLDNDIFSFTINGYYDSISNMMFIPTSIINEFFVSDTVDPIFNYAAIGTIIGHEIMHCFDNSGSLYDYVGHLRNWWSPNDYLKFNKELEKVKKHYGKLMINGNNLNSELTVGENIADIIGIKLSLRTYIKKSMPNTYSNLKNGYQNLSTNEKNQLKKFFEKWVTILRSVDDTIMINQMIRYDVHSPSVIRINAPFSHIKEYYIIYDVKQKNRNYLAPENRTILMDY
jgi:predicted metalloendopeptidase